MLLSILEIIGVFMMSISGVLTAANKKLDYFGAMVIGFLTCLGGGTIRDLLLNVEVSWMRNSVIIYTALGGGVIGILFHRKLMYLKNTLFIFDTIGLGLFTLLGLKKSLALDHLAITAVFLGTITATFGGVLRDVLCNDIPLIFRKQIYATACIVGALTYLLLTVLSINELISTISSVLIIISIRLFSVIYGWEMPKLKKNI